MARSSGSFSTRFAKWDEMLAQPQPKEKNGFVNAMYRYSRGLAFAGLGKVKEAKAGTCGDGGDHLPDSEQDMLMINSARSCAGNRPGGTGRENRARKK